MIKTCSRCEKQFDCCNEHRGCWCEDHALSTETLKMLQGRYDNCLCPSCLKIYSEEKIESRKHED